MEIIKMPKYMEYYGKCYECGCEFKYDPRDIEYIHLPHIYTPNNEFDDKDYNFSYVTCPWCGGTLNTEKISKKELGIKGE